MLGRLGFRLKIGGGGGDGMYRIDVLEVIYFGLQIVLHAGSLR